MPLSKSEKQWWVEAVKAAQLRRHPLLGVKPVQPAVGWKITTHPTVWEPATLVAWGVTDAMRHIPAHAVGAFRTAEMGRRVLTCVISTTAACVDKSSLDQMTWACVEHSYE